MGYALSSTENTIVLHNVLRDARRKLGGEGAPKRGLDKLGGYWLLAYISTPINNPYRQILIHNFI